MKRKKRNVKRLAYIKPSPPASATARCVETETEKSFQRCKYKDLGSNIKHPFERGAEPVECRSERFHEGGRLRGRGWF